MTAEKLNTILAYGSSAALLLGIAMCIFFAWQATRKRRPAEPEDSEGNNPAFLGPYLIFEQRLEWKHYRDLDGNSVWEALAAYSKDENDPELHQFRLRLVLRNNRAVWHADHTGVFWQSSPHEWPADRLSRAKAHCETLLDEYRKAELASV